jgi:hypothetical protein
MGSEDDRARDKRVSEQGSVDEIHRLIARRRETARVGRVIEHKERPEHPDQAPVPSRH